MTLEIWTGAGRPFFYGWVVDLFARFHTRKSAFYDIRLADLTVDCAYQIPGEWVRSVRMRCRVDDTTVGVGAFGDTEVHIIDRHSGAIL